VNDERAVFFRAQDLVRAKHLAQEAIAGRALFGEDTALADAGVDQEAEGQRQAGFLGEIADDLRAAVLFEGEIVLGEAKDHLALSIADRGEEVDNADIRREHRGVLGAGDCGQQHPQKQMFAREHFKLYRIVPVRPADGFSIAGGSRATGRDAPG